MSILHLCNTFFEWELAGHTPNTLKKALAMSPFFLQLQFLPLLFAKKTEGILVTEIPPLSPGKNLFILDNPPPFDKLETWGYSLLAKAWAKKHKIAYPMPPWDIVKTVNSKAYSFAKSPLLGAQLLKKNSPLPPRSLLKSCFGTAGKGHLFSDHPKALSFCQKEWASGLPVLAEPWVERTLDFSTQWHISSQKEIQFLGTTLCKTSSSGIHQSNQVGINEKLFADHLVNHKHLAKKVLQEMSEMGYFGPVGFDAMVYNKDQLQPIVEINARKTMGWVALKYQQAHFPEQSLELSYTSKATVPLLPTHLKNVHFSKNLMLKTKDLIAIKGPIK